MREKMGKESIGERRGKRENMGDREIGASKKDRQGRLCWNSFIKQCCVFHPFPIVIS